MSEPPASEEDAPEGERRARGLRAERPPISPHPTADAVETGRRPSRGLALASAASYVLLFAWLTWRWMMKAGTAFADGTDPRDSRLILWILWWVEHWLRGGLAGNLFDAPIFHPTPRQLTGSEHFLTSQLVFAPVRWISGSPLLAANVVALASYPATAFAMERLLVALRLWWAAAWLGGVVFALGAFRVPASVHVLQLHVVFLPLSVLALLRLRRQPTWLAAILVTGCLTAGMLSSYYLAVLLCLNYAVWVAVEALRSLPGRWRFLTMAAAALVVSSLLLGWVSRPYLARRAELGGATSTSEAHSRPPAEAARAALGGVDPDAYVRRLLVRTMVLGDLESPERLTLWILAAMGLLAIGHPARLPGIAAAMGCISLSLLVALNGIPALLPPAVGGWFEFFRAPLRAPAPGDLQALSRPSSQDRQPGRGRLASEQPGGHSDGRDGVHRSRVATAEQPLRPAPGAFARHLAPARRSPRGNPRAAGAAFHAAGARRIRRRVAPAPTARRRFSRRRDITHPARGARRARAPARMILRHRARIRDAHCCGHVIGGAIGLAPQGRCAKTWIFGPGRTTPAMRPSGRRKASIGSMTGSARPASNGSNVTGSARTWAAIRPRPRCARCSCPVETSAPMRAANAGSSPVTWAASSAGHAFAKAYGAQAQHASRASAGQGHPFPGPVSMLALPGPGAPRLAVTWASAPANRATRAAPSAVPASRGTPSRPRGHRPVP